jgi:hypothetical protein
MMRTSGRGVERIWGSAAAIAAVAACVALGAAGVQAHEGGSATHSGAELRGILGGSFERLENGLFRVELPGGGSLTTHGPDPRSAMNPLELDGVLPGGVQTRQPACATDHFQHVLYGHLAGTPDLLGVNASLIRTSMLQANALLAADSFESGGVTADYKVLCDEDGQIKVDSFAAPSASFADIVAAAKAAGFDDPRADYTIFFDAISTACGIGSYTVDSSLSADNRSNRGGGYGIAYQGCWLDETPMHENGHNQGAVQPETPNSTGTGGHCSEERDVLCYSPDGGDRNQGGVVSRCGTKVTFDCGNDDYFDSAPEPGEYLAENWNLGSALNRFIVYGQGNPIGPGSQGSQADPPCEERRCAVPISTDGTERTGQAAATGGWSFYRVAIPKRSKRVEFVLRGPACEGTCDTDLDLYARSKRPPSEKKFDCSSKRVGSAEKCRVKRPRGGRFYVGVRSVKSAAGASFTIRTSAGRAR